jgi:hypothetical protein
VGEREDLRAQWRLCMERAKATSDPRLKRELATRAFKLAQAAEALGGEAEFKSPWHLSHGDARGDSITQVFETKDAAIDAACALVGRGAYVFEVGPIQEGHGGLRLNGVEIRRIFDERARITEWLAPPRGS